MSALLHNSKSLSVGCLCSGSFIFQYQC